MSDVISVFLR